MLAIREERNEGKKKPRSPCYVVGRQRCVPPGQAAGKGGRDTVVTTAVLAQESSQVSPPGSCRGLWIGDPFSRATCSLASPSSYGLGSAAQADDLLK